MKTKVGIRNQANRTYVLYMKIKVKLIQEFYLVEKQLNNEVHEQGLRKSSRNITQSIMLDGYEMFLDHVIIKDNDLILDSMIAELEPFNLNQTLNDSNWIIAMKDVLTKILCL